MTIRNMIKIHCTGIDNTYQGWSKHREIMSLTSVTFIPNQLLDTSRTEGFRWIEVRSHILRIMHNRDAHIRNLTYSCYSHSP
jgi:hypothetical protein